MITPQRRPYTEKQGMSVVIRMRRFRIEGILHVSYNHRATDTLNGHDTFVPITAARLYDSETNALLSEHDFIAVNKQEIVFLHETEARPRS